MDGIIPSNSRNMLDSIKITDTIPLASRLIPFPVKDAFMIEANGNMMAPDILHKDMLVCDRKAKLKNKAIVICKNAGEIVCKYYYKKGNNIYLFNAKHDIFEIAPDFNIMGVVKVIIRMF